MQRNTLNANSSIGLQEYRDVFLSSRHVFLKEMSIWAHFVSKVGDGAAKVRQRKNRFQANADEDDRNRNYQDCRPNRNRHRTKTECPCHRHRRMTNPFYVVNAGDPLLQK
jgi:hypothetical protein